MSTFADRLAGAMRHAGFTSNADLARRIGCSRAAVSKWLHGDPFGDVDLLMKLCDALQVSPKWLLYNEGTPAPLVSVPDNEYELLHAFRKLRPAQQASVVTLVTEMAK
jgi:transcriptional regulator with XRE-family HTH domain